MKQMNRHSRRLMLRFARLRRNCDGVAAVEFALILPLMLLIYLGCSEVTQALMADQRLVIAAHTMADLVAQQPANTSLTDTQLSDIYKAAAVILAPFPSTPFKVTLTSVQFVANAGAATGYDAKPQWTIVYNGSAPRPCKILTAVANGGQATPTTIPVGIYGPGSVIVADTAYTYTPSFGGALLAWSTTQGSLTFTQTNYLRPRDVATVPYTAGSGTVCPAY